MIVRIFLLLSFFVCCFGAYFLFKNSQKHKIFGMLLSAFGLVILGLFIFTFLEMDLPVQSRINKETVIRYISNNPDGVYERPLSYKFESNIGTEPVGMYQIIKIETDGAPSQKEVENIFLNKIDELHFEDIMIGTSEVENRLYRHLCPFFTVVSKNNDIDYYFFPTLSEPYSPRSFLFKGCTYSSSYRNFFAWYHNNVIYIYMEMSDSSYGKTLTEADANKVAQGMIAQECTGDGSRTGDRTGDGSKPLKK